MFKQQGSITKRPSKILKNLGFVGGNFDPYLYVKKSSKGIVYIALYMDDNLMVGDVEAISHAISSIKSNGMVLKVVEGL